ncbi:putative Signal transduction histidine kinase [Candidatus Terasakiella magnetica]|uniref:histidine kinase n=1 Tax=Candidatus Terasakiella magnetica TaxID=1867952 RepID=A0A1C3RHU5_9PROT|nr:response regulator [Candidatus Terasakiella magnetica]SCA56849.1 putative Signal transduction histidine kinase [Candidatus Terasakiella magnetica]
MKWNTVKPIEWAVVGVVAILIGAIYVLSPEIDGEQHADILQDIAVLEEDNSIITAIVVETRFGMLPNFDSLVTAVNTAAQEGKELKSKLPFEEEQSLVEAWQAYQETFDGKLEVIEDFKSHSAVLKNSVSYIPIAIREFLEVAAENDSDPKLINAAQTLLIESLIFSQDYGFEHVDSVQESVHILMANQDKVSADLLDKIQGVLLHAQAIIDFKSEVDGLVNTIFKTQTDLKIQQVLAAYLVAHNRKHEQVDRYRAFLVILASLLALMIISLLFRLTRTTNRLKKSLDEVNFQKFALDQHAIVSIADVKGNIVYANKKFCEISGYKLDELLGRDHRIVKSNEHDPAFFKEMWKTIAQGKVWTGTIKNKAKDGSIYWVNSTIVPFLDENNKPFRYVSIRTDITNRVEMEAALEQARDEAEQGNRSKSEFLANMSHEIRTPMNAVIGLSHLLLHTKLDETQHDYVSKVLSSGNLLLDIINDILDFSKIEAGKLDFENIEFNLDDVFEEVFTLININALKKGLKLSLDRKSDVRHHLIGDPLRLKQILINIASNAVKFTHKGEITFVLDEVKRDSDKIKLQFSITDTGVGLSEEQAEKLFSSFSQADTSTTRQYGGTGLGLSICKKLVELMKGEIKVESTIGEGSTFTFSAEFGLGEEKTQSAKEITFQVQGAKVIVVDDEQTSLDIFEDMLQGFGFEVTTSLSAAQAIGEISKAKEAGEPFEYAVVDWKMPKQDGISLCEEIKDDFHKGGKSRIILVTAFDADIARRLIKRDLYNELLLKPVMPSSLLNAIQSCQEEEIVKQAEHLECVDEGNGVSGAKVLVVEDNIINQKVAIGLLKSFGVSCDVANNGLEGVQAVKDNLYDAVLMDIQMPLMDGVEATTEIRKDSADLPIIAMTAHAMKEEQDKCKKAGMNDYVTKPVNPSNLLEALQRWVRQD